MTGTGDTPRLTDIGVNLGAAQFAADRDAVVAGALAAGVRRLLITGTSLAESRTALALAAHYRQFATAGVHPHHASEWTDAIAAELRGLCAQPRVVALGECGLDFNRNFSTPADQERAFHAQLALAAELGKPVFLHCRDASARFIAIYREYRAQLAGGVLHCFTDGPDALVAALEQDLYIGVTGWVCDERRGDALRAAVPLIPADRLLLETDAPWLMPRSHPLAKRVRRNLPEFLPYIAAAVAALRGESLARMLAQCERNADRLFALPAPESLTSGN